MLTQKCSQRSGVCKHSSTSSHSLADLLWKPGLQSHLNVPFKLTHCDEEKRQGCNKIFYIHIFNIFVERENVELNVGKMYWLFDPNSKLTLKKQLLVYLLLLYKAIIKPVWTCGIPTAINFILPSINDATKQLNTSCHWGSRTHSSNLINTNSCAYFKESIF